MQTNDLSPGLSKGYFLYMKYPRLIFVLAAVGALAGCPTAESGPTYTVHGTVTVESADTGDAVVMITEGSNSYSVSVPITIRAASWDYSVSGVPAGTYSLSLSYPATGSVNTGEYFLNGNGNLGYPLTVSEPLLTVTATADSVTVDANLQLDADIFFFQGQ
jgi:hypothetical protein